MAVITLFIYLYSSCDRLTAELNPCLFNAVYSLNQQRLTETAASRQGIVQTEAKANLS